MSAKSPLGERSSYPASYSPDLLHPISRMENRRILGLGTGLPFHGEDVWNAYELTWLDAKDKPRVAVAELRVPCESANIIESKSMKLYLNSLSMSRYESADDVTATIADDLTRVTGSPVTVKLISPEIGVFPGVCIDDLEVICDSTAVDAELLRTEDGESRSEVLHSHLLRSLCPVTDQPDLGSLLIRYEGPAINRESLLRYITTFRNHNDFHESCVERIFLDIKQQCSPEALTVYARYNRRGGIDINPFRSNYETTVANTRLWRQ